MDSADCGHDVSARPLLHSWWRDFRCYFQESLLGNINAMRDLSTILCRGITRPALAVPLRARLDEHPVFVG